MSPQYISPPLYSYNTIPTNCWSEFKLYELGKTPVGHLLVRIQLTHQSATTYDLSRVRNTIFTLNELTDLEKIEDISGTNVINLSEENFYLVQTNTDLVHSPVTPHSQVKTFSSFIDLREELNALMIEECL